MTLDDLNFHMAYPDPKCELYHHFREYPYKLEFNIVGKTVPDVYEVEMWCKEHFGELEEYEPKSRWQVSCERIDTPIRTSSGLARIKYEIYYFDRAFSLLDSLSQSSQ